MSFTTIKLISKDIPGDKREVRVFVGVDREHMQLAGTLILHVGEEQLFGAALLLGANRTRGHLEVISELQLS